MLFVFYVSGAVNNGNRSIEKHLLETIMELNLKDRLDVMKLQWKRYNAVRIQDYCHAE